MPKPYIPNDAWSRKAAKEGYRARSVYKLMELDEKFHLLKPAITVLDLAAAPGSWLQYTVKKVGPKGRVIGIDLEPIKPIAPNVTTIQADITNSETVNRVLSEISHTSISSSTPHPSSIGGGALPFLPRRKGLEDGGIDLVLSDIAPSTSGIKDIDQWRSVALNQAVLALAHRFLKPHGRCVLKVFRGADFDAFLREVKEEWEEVKLVKVSASRDRSKEIYLVIRKRA